MRVPMPPRVPVLVAVVAVVTAAACADRSVSPTGPAAVRGQTAATQAAGAAGVGAVRSITGRVIVTTRQLAGAPAGGTTVAVDTGSYSIQIDPAGQARGWITLKGGAASEALLATKNGRPQGGRSDATIQGATGVATISQRGAAGEPASETEVRFGNGLVVRTARTWRRDRGLWRLEAQVLTFVKSGVPVTSVTSRYDDGVESAVPGAGALKRATGGATLDEYGPCDAQLISMKEAFNKYEIATVGMLGCFGGPLACVAVSLNCMSAAASLDAAIERLELCLAGPMT